VHAALVGLVEAHTLSWAALDDAQHIDFTRCTSRWACRLSGSHLRKAQRICDDKAHRVWPQAAQLLSSNPAWRLDRANHPTSSLTTFRTWTSCTLGMHVSRCSHVTLLSQAKFQATRVCQQRPRSKQHERYTTSSVTCRHNYTLCCKWSR
jgi:hypothetical protein